MLNKLLSRKFLVLIIVPLFAVLLQFIIRLYTGKDFNTIGITLSAIALGQMLPYLCFEHFIINKILGINPQYTFQSQQLSIKYKLSAEIDMKKIEEVKTLYYTVILIDLLLFVVTILAGMNGQVVHHILFGAFSCVITWILMIYY